VLFYDGHVRWIAADSDLGRALGYASETTGGEPPLAAVEKGQAVLGPQQRPQPQPPGERSAGKEIDNFSRQGGEQPAQAEAELDVQQRAEYDRKQAEANVKRGNYADAVQLYEDALRLQPESREAKEQLDRVRQIAKLAPQSQPGENFRNVPVKGKGSFAGAATESAPVPGLIPLKVETSVITILSLSAIKDYAAQLKQDLAEGKLDDLAEDEMQRDILSLTAGRTKRIAFKSGGTVELADGDLSVRGTQAEIAEVESAATALQTRMLAKAREVTAARQREESALAARKRAELEQRVQASLVAGGLKGGTISGNRGAGAMALDISFPSFGTRAYPFHMDYAGSSQARIELKCLHEGVALVLQALVGLALLIGLGAAWWRSARAGLILTALAALALVVAWSAGGEIVKQYVVTGVAGVLLSLLVFLARRAAQRAAQRAARA
jgi:hypothetical protein